MMSTRFEEIIGNTRIFGMILDGFFENWPGSYDVMPAEDTRSRLFTRHTNFGEFCREIRRSEEGELLCIQCDEMHAKIAAREERPISYICHAGLVDIAVPIVVDRKLVATIFCGQCRPGSATQDLEGKRRAQMVEEKLRIPAGRLQALRTQTPQVPDEVIEELKNKLWEVATYVSTLGSRKVDAERARQRLAYRLRESEAIQAVMQNLAEIVDDVDVFWARMDDTLSGLGKIIGAKYAVLVTCQKSPGSEASRMVVRSIAQLPDCFRGRIYTGCDPVILEALRTMRPQTLRFQRCARQGTPCWDILALEDDATLDQLAVVPLKLGPEYEGAMVFFLSPITETTDSLVIDDELSLLASAASQITTAYENCQLYKSRKWLAEVQGEWLENVSHQLLAPLNEILGQVENLSRSFKRWHEDKPERIENALETLTELSYWAARLASNFAWIARAEEYVGNLSLQPEEDVVGRFIGYARNVQGMAREHHLSRVHVDKTSIVYLDRKIQIDRRFFKQAVQNLLDNAVKYANVGTEVLIHATKSETEARIHVTNCGIRVKEEEVDRIFDRNYRTGEARQKYAIGTGIGLTIARDIIRLHDGLLYVRPSVETPRGWKTTFTIVLPLIEDNEGGG